MCVCTYRSSCPRTLRGIFRVPWSFPFSVCWTDIRPVWVNSFQTIHMSEFCFYKPCLWQGLASPAALCDAPILKRCWNPRSQLEANPLVQFLRKLVLLRGPDLTTVPPAVQAAGGRQQQPCPFPGSRLLSPPPAPGQVRPRCSRLSHASQEPSLGAAIAFAL